MGNELNIYRYVYLNISSYDDGLALLFPSPARVACVSDSISSSGRTSRPFFFGFSCDSILRFCSNRVITKATDF